MTINVINDSSGTEWEFISCMVRTNICDMPDNVDSDGDQSPSLRPGLESRALNDSVGRAIADQDFVERVIELLKGMEFPAFKQEILDYVTEANMSEDQVLSVLNTLSGYNAYRELNQVREAIEVNRPRTRHHGNDSPDTFPTQGQGEHAAEVERSRYESTPTRKHVSETKVNVAPDRNQGAVMAQNPRSAAVCDLCGATFATANQLVQHKKEEKGEP